MDIEDLAHARQRAQQASSRARLATDPDLKHRWLELAEAWRAHLSAIEAGVAEPPTKSASGPP